jgi:hypothetical protein
MNLFGVEPWHRCRTAFSVGRQHAKSRTGQPDIAQLFGTNLQQRERACESMQSKWVAFTAPYAAIGQAGTSSAAYALR